MFKEDDTEEEDWESPGSVEDVVAQIVYLASALHNNGNEDDHLSLHLAAQEDKLAPFPFMAGTQLVSIV